MVEVVEGDGSTGAVRLGSWAILIDNPERPRLRFGAILVGFGFVVRGDPEHDQYQLVAEGLLSTSKQFVFQSLVVIVV